MTLYYHWTASPTDNPDLIVSEVTSDIKDTIGYFPWIKPILDVNPLIKLELRTPSAIFNIACTTYKETP